jgi:gliding motility-associated-like protein
LRVILTFILASACLLSYGQNFTNKGREFWVGYGHNDLFSTNVQEMVIYLSAEQPANVTINIPGTAFTKTYSIPANTVVVSDVIPKSGAADCRINGEGLFTRAVHIVSDVAIVAYAHMYGENSSGAAMLLPVETYGYTYNSINTSQDYGNKDFSWFYVIAAENNTRVRITPSNNTMGGRQQDLPFEVPLNKGQLYNVLGYTNPNTSNSVGSDMSGSEIVSIAGADGKCHPISVFSGSSRTYVCTPMPLESGGDFLMQQVFPVTAWGARYLTGNTSSSEKASIINTNRYRIYVRDGSTAVYANGTKLTNLINYAYYDFSSPSSQYITADQPIMVAQLIPSQAACNTTGKGDPEIIFLSPMEQAIKKVAFYSTNKENILQNYVTLTIHKNGFNSLLIDNSSAVDTFYEHPGNPDYLVVVKELALSPSQHNIQSDSGFNAIAYGLGDHESYGYNAGCYVNNLTYLAELKNEYSATPNEYTCPQTPFYISLKTLYTATSLTWHFSQVPGITPASDVVVNNATPTSTEIVDGKTYNVYKQPVPATVPAAGFYYIPITIVSPSIDNCTNSDKLVLEVEVKPGPTAAFTYIPACATDTTTFTGSSADAAVDQWLWDFGNGVTKPGQQSDSIFTAAGNYTVKLQASRSLDGCVANVSKQVTIPGMPSAAFDIPAIVCFPGGEAKFVNKTTVPGAPATALQYAWTFGDGGTAVDKNPTHYYAGRNNYPVTLISTTAAGCSDTTDGTVATFGDRPTAGFDVANPAQCVGKEFSFTDKSTIPGNIAVVAWKWIFGDGTTGAGATTTKSYRNAGSYKVNMYVTSSEGCISDTASSVVKAYPLPVVEAGPDLITEPGKAVQIKATLSPVSATVTWSPASYLSAANILQPMASPLENQRYYITATGELGCTGTDSMLVKVFKELKVPNAFTPNGDGRNDTWNIPGLEDYKNATIQVFNRWGQIVFKSTGYSHPWRGDINGNPLPTGAYYYVIQPKEGGYGTISGMVMIIR